MTRSRYLTWTREKSLDPAPYELQLAHGGVGAVLGTVIGLILWLVGGSSAKVVGAGALLGYGTGAVVAIGVQIEGGIFRWRVRRGRARW